MRYRMRIRLASQAWATDIVINAMNAVNAIGVARAVSAVNEALLIVQLPGKI